MSIKINARNSRCHQKERRIENEIVPLYTKNHEIIWIKLSARANLIKITWKASRSISPLRKTRSDNLRR
jgi:hypothetical protein